MAEVLDPKELVTLQELAVSNAFEIATLVSVLDRKGVITRVEVVEEIAIQKRRRPLGR